MTESGANPVERVACPECGASLLAGEPLCWKCGAATTQRTDTATPELIDFSEGTGAQTVAPHRTAPPRPTRTLAGDEVDESDFSAPAYQPQAPNPPRAMEPEAPDRAPTRMATTLTGEVVEIPDFAAQAAQDRSDKQPEQPSPSAPPESEAPAAPVMRITFCKTCGIQNEETATVCRKCRQPLEVIAEPLPDIKPLRRSWGFDVLGVAWIALGMTAAYCGQFIIKADPAHPGISWGDYIWTGVVVCAPGVLIFMRHWFSRLMFWAMTFASAMIWAVIGFIWLYIGLHVSDNGRVGLMWFAALSGLSLISFITVRLNDEFDAGA